MDTNVFTSAVIEADGTYMVEFANNLLKTPNFWLLLVGAFIVWAMTRYIPELVNGKYKKGSHIHTSSIHRYRHRKIKRSSSRTRYFEDKQREEGSSQNKTTKSISHSSSLQSIKSPLQSKSAYANSTPDFVPLSASIQSAPPSPPHFKTPSRIVPTNYGSEIKLKLMSSEDKALRLSNMKEQHMKFRPTISSRLNPIRRCELGQRSSVGVLSSRYLADVKMDIGYNEDQRKNIIWAAGNRNEHYSQA
ncbi:hypothetical protein RhiirA5_365960 [Rhizophagus irregularis]|uniref:Uncharacterized protein n=5 Tax=Rhizophagus irregularis TaxID=588596 RepID=A0A2I1GT76_9GLOM|nr:hypothetical protein GLOIN_2v1522977 [Rhizophagus irregularis DAOM 181602=DAOM 197198]EXX57091.1 hypothetical protein RirG_210360 [Rhizophagus irregularis DAOM 197198w]PKC00029.1 hypothetical protein RhiirA5_365960 [Rhizophagus irregularis]PKC62826.1 hypothetical protein RhiirA1_423422 [Rhizophagus irregularis]PKK72557.1 hypothetical protein RhiirC2_742454 [Rhizophagus irregularis]PKY19169.1 hypothetical protein RhiirB3_406496 [Rhizophagus irregularis]|eukprot:XP_025186621.1 hypothetical protein GLOIN_2v1522977 [Rhizophagus irregularis DAOM 181602=DAOM 197198]